MVAKAQLDNLIHLRSVGMASDADVDAQRVIFENLRNFKSTEIKEVVVVKEIETKPQYLPLQAQVADEEVADAELAAILGELSEIDNLKNEKINELQAADRKVNQKRLVNEVKALRDRYLEKSDEVYYYKKHGCRPDNKQNEDVSLIRDSYADSLPRDTFSLIRMKLNLESNLSKYNSRMNQSKTQAKKQHYLQKISEAHIKINVIEQLMTTL